MRAALAAERADEVTTVVWLGDGAKENWTLATEVCPSAIQELMACLDLTTTEEQLAALDDVVGYFRTNQKRMRYRTFRSQGFPVGSGIVETAHRHVLQVRLRAAYRTAGAFNFHRAIRDGLSSPTSAHTHRPVTYGRRMDLRQRPSM